MIIHIKQVQISDVNEAPTLNNMPYTTTIKEDAVYGASVFKVLASDQDNNPLNWTIVALPDMGPFVVDTTTNDKGLLVL